MSTGGLHSAPPPVPDEGAQTPELRLESELLSMIGTFIAEKVDTTGDIKLLRLIG